MEIASEIARQLRKLTSAPDLLHVAEVVKVEGETCTVDLGGLELSGVRLRAVADGSDTGLLLSPKVGSYVLVADLSDGALRQLAVIAYSEVDTISIHGGDKGGLVNIENLKNNLDSLRRYVEALKSAVATGLNGVGTSTEASGQAGATAFNSAMAGHSINFENMEDTTIKH